MKSGFSLIELMISMVFLSVALLAILTVTSFSTREAMDTYYQFLAVSLAKEPIEVFKSFGYQFLNDYDKHPLKNYPIGPTVITYSDDSPGVYPLEATMFEREIIIGPESEEGKVKARKITVFVRPIPKSRVAAWFSRHNDVKLESLIVDGPK
ncbi:prepilin-type N-terminal cleavage/methylation domain-containing protein [bacterium]|nr:prepilin-type N-terminal cleavage/methylation domain-containing protein [bacterium]